MVDNNYKNLIDKAYNLHIAGKLDEAKLIYEKVLELFPDNLDVLNLYAQLNFSLSNYDKALEIFDYILSKVDNDDIKLNIAKIHYLKNDFNSAIFVLNSVKNHNVSTLSWLSNSYINNSDFFNAVSILLRIYSIDTKNLDAIFNLSICYKSLNNLDKALEFALLSYQLNSNDYNICINLSSIYHLLNDAKNELLYLEKAAIFSNNSQLFYNCGVLAKQIENNELALVYFNKVLELEPENVKAMKNIAHIYKSIDKLLAFDMFKEIYENNPDDNSLLYELLYLSQIMLDYENAVFYSKKIIELEPNNPLYYIVLSDNLMYLYRYKEAEIVLAKAYELDKENITCKHHYAMALYANGNIDKAVSLIENHLDNKSCAILYGKIYLKERNFDKAKECFYIQNTQTYDVADCEKKAREMYYKLNVKEKSKISEEEFAQFRINYESPDLDKVKLLQEKLIKNEDYTDKNLLVFSSHGLGDVLMSIRYFPIIASKTKKCLFSMPKSLHRLLKFNFPHYELFDSDSVISSDLYDYSIPELCLMYILNADFYNIPSPEGYLKIPENLVKEKFDLNLFNNNKKKIGIFWQGNAGILRNRSVKLKYFLPIINNENVQMYSFQLSKVDDESHKLKSELPIIDLAPYITDYADTAALLKNIDILITIDSSIAHLAGALGINTFLLLPYDSEWRWFHDTETTPWYNSIRIFKQTSPDDWESVISRVNKEL